jgi:predicted acetyltransferase
MRAMMRTQLDDVHARDEPVAILFASEETIYGRYGYGIASLHASVEIPRNRSSFARPLQARARTRLVGAEEALELFPPVYDAVRRERPGAFARSRTWWESRLLADQEWRRRGGAALQRVVLEHDGRPEGYALYRLQQSIEHGTSTGQVRVIEAVGATPRAENEIWRLLLDIDWIDRVTAWLLPADHPLLLLLAEPRRAAFRLGDGLWLRVVDVEAAFAARSYAGDEAVVVDVTDAFCPWNEGRWRIGPEGATRTDAEPMLRLDASDLASLYLGGFTLGQLERAGRVVKLAGGAIEAGDRLLYTERAPWCPEIF